MPLFNQLNHWIDNQQFFRYGMLPITLTVSSCLASIAVMLILQNSAPAWQLMVCTAFAMGSNAMGIAMAPLRTVMWSFFASVAVSAGLIVANLV